MANKYERYRLIPDATVSTPLYQVPLATATICRSLRIINTNTVRAEVSLYQTDSQQAISITLLDQHIIAPRSEYDALNGIPLNLEELDLLSAKSSVSGVHFYLSCVEVDRN